jgi:hypothetical protein
MMAPKDARRNVPLRHELNQCVAYASHRDLFVGLERLAFAHGHDIALSNDRTTIPDGSVAPDGVVVRYMISRLGGFKKYCSAYRAIIEGNGFGVVVKRGVVTTLLQFSQTRSVLFVHARVASVLKTATEGGLVAVPSVLEEAQRRAAAGAARRALSGACSGGRLVHADRLSGCPSLPISKKAAGPRRGLLSGGSWLANGG